MAKETYNFKEVAVSMFSRLLAAHFAALVKNFVSTQDVVLKALKCLCMRICIYGVATISRLLKIIGLFCKRAL